VQGVKSLDPFEETSSRTPKGAAVSDDIDVAPSLSRRRPTPDPLVGQSWTALEAAGLLPKRPSDLDVEESPAAADEWPTDDLTPSGSVEVVSRPIPPPPPVMPNPSALAAATAAIVLNPTTPPPGIWPAARIAEPTESTDSVDAPVESPTELIPAEIETPEPATEPSAEPPTEAVPAVEARSVPVTAAPALAPSSPVKPFNDEPDRPARVLTKTVGRRRIFGRRPRVRKVSRVVRRIDGWTVFKISLVLYMLLYVVLLIAGVLLWHLAYTTGTVDNIQGFIKELFGLKTFTINGKKLFNASRGLGLFLAIAGTGLHVTLAVLFNLIADLVGGVRVTVLEEEVILRERLRGGPVAESIDADSDASDNLTAS
jgi:Transmembrane domain of unknown function (DUF3566)